MTHAIVASPLRPIGSSRYLGEDKWFFYFAHLLNVGWMYSDEDRAKIVHAEAKRLEQFLSPLSPADWQRPSACDQWQVADVVAHLAGFGLAERITRGLQGDLAPPQGQPPTGTLNEDAFRERIAQGSIAARERLGDQLLSVFITSNDQLDQVLAVLRPQDWETLCQHPMGPEPVRTWIDMRITELSMHGWDIRSRFDPQATLSTESLPVLLNTIPRAVRRAFRPEASRTPPVRYRFVVTGPSRPRRTLCSVGRVGAVKLPATRSLT